jgi:hypothetical protein
MEMAFSPEEQAQIYKEGKMTEVQSKKLALAMQQAQIRSENAQADYRTMEAAHPELFHKQTTDPLQSVIELMGLMNQGASQSTTPKKTNSMSLNPPASK